MERKIACAVTEYGMLSAYGKVIIGFSGGADSSALLHYFATRAEKVVCVHINHMIRGAEADRDEAFCKSMCDKYGVELVCHRIDIPSLAKERGMGIEETAREERYRVFNDECSTRGFDAILTAHNANDNVESVIFNLARGSGANGLSGIKPVNGLVLRPLIQVNRKEILAYCEEHKIPFVTDSTNDDTDYTRNYIRHKIVPELEKLNPSLTTAVARLCGFLFADEEFFTQVATEFIERSCPDNRLLASEFLKQKKSIKARVLKLLSGVNLDSHSIALCKSFVESAKCGDVINLYKGISLKCEGEYFVFIPTKELKGYVEFCYELSEGLNYIDEIGEVIAYNTSEEPIDAELYFTLSLNKESVKGILHARSRRDGDRISHGRLTKRLKKMMYEKKIPSHLRDRIPLICDDVGIVSAPRVATRDGASGEGIVIKFYSKQKEGSKNAKRH